MLDMYKKAGREKRKEMRPILKKAAKAVGITLNLSEQLKIREEFNPTVAPGSTYAIEVKSLGNKVSLTQDNNQVVVVHKDDIGDLISELNRMQEYLT